MRLLADWYADMRGLVSAFARGRRRRLPTVFCLHRWPLNLISLRTRIPRMWDRFITSSGAGLAPESSSPPCCCRCELLVLRWALGVEWGVEWPGAKAAWKEVVHDPGTRTRMGRDAFVGVRAGCGQLPGGWGALGAYFLLSSSPGLGRSILLWSSQMNPQSSRAMATMAFCSRLPRALSRT